MREDVAWAAGFFDGEGSIAIQRTGYAFITACQNDRELLDRLTAVLGVGIVAGPRASKGSTKTHYVWTVSGFERVQHALAQMWPWLSTRRRERAREVLLIARAQPARRAPFGEGKAGNDIACWRGHLRSEEGVRRTDGKWQCRKCQRDRARARRGSTGVGYIEARRLKGLDSG